jgi:hypothetical protein
MSTLIGKGTRQFYLSSSKLANIEYPRVQLNMRRNDENISYDIICIN